MISNLLNVWSTNAATSLVIWGLVSMVILYLGRKQAHQVLYSTGRTLVRSTRMCCFSIKRLEAQWQTRNLRLVDATVSASSALTQWVISALVLVAAGLAGVINYRLLEASTSAIGGSITMPGLMANLDLYASTLVLLELVVGLFLVELLGITRAFKSVNTLEPKLKKQLAGLSCVVIVSLAGIEALLVPAVEQKMIVAALALVLAFSTIALVTFVHSMRVIAADCVLGGLRLLRVSVRILGLLISQLSVLCRHIYDLFIVIPLGVERIVKNYMDREVEIDVPMLTRVEAEALKNKRHRSQNGLLDMDALPELSTKATIKSISTKKEEPKKFGVRKVIEGSTLDNVNLAETMMSSSL